MKKTADLRQFFEEYAQHSFRQPQALTSFYAADFIAAGPQGSRSYRNDDKFVEWLDQMETFNKQTGLTGMQVEAVREIPMGEAFTMATVTWAATYKKTGDQPITFDISYCISFVEDTPRIILFISHEDQESVMKEKGLL